MSGDIINMDDWTRAASAPFPSSNATNDDDLITADERQSIRMWSAILAHPETAGIPWFVKAYAQSMRDLLETVIERAGAAS